jgi:hypothetical protein
MKYFKDENGGVHAFDETDINQKILMNELAGNWVELSNFPPIPKPSELLSSAKSNAYARIDAYGKAQRVKIAGTPDEIEIAAWNNKLVIAKAIKAGTASAGDKAAFQAEINARGKGETIDAFADKVLINASFYAQAVGLIDGLKRRTQDAVNAANTPEEVEATLVAMKSQAEAAFAQLMGAAK